MAPSDYAINGGHRFIRYGEGPHQLPVPSDFSWPDMTGSTGISHMRSRVMMAQITDGASYTYLVAEKHLRMDRYELGIDLGDNESMYSGDDLDIIRNTGAEFDTSYHPVSDLYRARQEGRVFGSAHANGFHAVLCDGSTRLITYGIDQSVHSRLGRRSDGEVVELPR